MLGPIVKSYSKALSHETQFEVHMTKLQYTVASFPGLLSPNAVEGLVNLLRRMTSGGRWVYIYMGGRWVDVRRRGTSGEAQSAAR